MSDPYAITTIDQLREYGDEVSPRAAVKAIDRIDDICARFIAASPFCVLATIGADGMLDQSPKGDPAGFVHVLDEKTLALPDRPGNRRYDSFENILHTPEVALIFAIPGHSDTLRVAGKARLTRDPDLCQRLAVNNRPAQFVVLIEVAEAMMHCSKCMIRSRMWQPDHWPDTSDVATLAEAVLVHGQLIEKNLVEDLDAMERAIETDAKNRLY